MLFYAASLTSYPYITSALDPAILSVILFTSTPQPCSPKITNFVFVFVSAPTFVLPAIA